MAVERFRLTERELEDLSNAIRRPRQRANATDQMVIGEVLWVVIDFLEHGGKVATSDQISELLRSALKLLEAA